MPTLVAVNGKAIDAAGALRIASLHENKFLQDTINHALVRQYAETKSIRNTDQELQLAADELRYSRGLEKVDSAEQWMRENNQTLLSIQEAVDSMLLRNKVRNAIPAAQIQAYYAEHQLELESVELYSIRVENEGKAKELLAAINDEGANFHVLAMEHSQDEDTRRLGGYVGNLTRSQVTGAVEAVVFKAKPGSVIGPVKTDHGWNLFKVAALHKPSLEEARTRIQLDLLEDLLRKLRSEASIEYSMFAETSGESA